MSPRRIGGTLAATGLAAAILGGCASVPAVPISNDDKKLEEVRKLIDSRPLPRESCLLGGRGLALESKVALSDKALDAAVREIFSNVRAEWSKTRDLPPIDVFVVAGDDYDAYTNVENQIALNVAVLGKAESVDEIAFILAHEAGHVFLGHVAERRTKQKALKRAVGVAGEGITYGVMLANAKRVNTNPNSGFRVDSKLDKGDLGTMAAAASGARILTVLSAEVGDSLISRAQESEADQFAYDRMIAREYSREGAKHFYIELTASEHTRREQAAFLRGTVKETTKLAVAWAASDAGKVSGGMGTMVNLFAEPLGGALEKLLTEAVDPLKKRYDPVKERQDIATNYENAHYFSSKEVSKKDSRFRTDKKLAALVLEYAEASRYYQESDAAIANHDIDKASEFAKQPVLLRRTPILAALARARVAEAQGNFAEAALQAEKAAKSPNAPPEAFTIASRNRSFQGQHTAAFRLLDEGEKRFCTREPFLVARAGAAAFSGSEEAIRNAVRDCDATDDATIQNECYVAVKAKIGEVSGSSPTVPQSGSGSGSLLDMVNNLTKL